MRTAGFKARMAAREVLAGTFVKTPSHDVIEVLALSGLDFLCLDAEHAAFDRTRLDVCLAVARALDMPTLVRVARGTPEAVLQALDMGAAGVVVPHVGDAATAASVARSARYGAGGRGYAGSTRAAGYATRAMADVLSGAAASVVIAQIESPEAVAEADAIAATDGIDGVFLGPADLSVALGEHSMDSAALRTARADVGRAVAAAGKTYATFVASGAAAADVGADGVTMFFVASEHAWMLAGARAAVAALHASGVRDA